MYVVCATTETARLRISVPLGNILSNEHSKDLEDFKEILNQVRFSDFLVAYRIEMYLWKSWDVA